MVAGSREIRKYMSVQIQKLLLGQKYDGDTLDQTCTGRKFNKLIRHRVIGSISCYSPLPIRGS